VPEDSGSSFKSPVLELKGWLWVFWKSQKMLTVSDQYLLSYVKTTGGEVKLTTPPPLAGIGLIIYLKNMTSSVFKNINRENFVLLQLLFFYIVVCLFYIL